ncbi:MAG: DNA polymerase III subunit gamma/tau [Chloroflexota bacterium]|nr:DNA polymerase III subunit gamma/tau [Chloroflexota bacterium]
MPSQSLYRKWRSRTFSELIGQEHITETLTNALRAGRISHAYLFCGPRGTGKTSTARLLAKAVNCQDRQGAEPCNHCEMCLAIQDGRAMDLIEIDAASNRGIDEIRELRDKVGFAPSQGKYKFYILDEVHMLTTEAFNALLKTLEEPPEHAIFVLVTTESHKIPATIISRCQRFDFRRVALRDLMSKLERICREEALEIEPAALELIARSATGSFRDAESLLDQLAAYRNERITLDYVQKLLGLIPSESVGRAVEALLKRDLSAGLALINQVADEGADLRQFNREIVAYLHGMLLIKAGNPGLLNVTAESLETMNVQAKSCSLGELMRSLRLFGQADQALRNSSQPQLPLELAFVDATSQETAAEPARGLARVAAQSVTSVAGTAAVAGPPYLADQTGGRARSQASPLGVGAQRSAHVEPPAVAVQPAVPSPAASAGAVAREAGDLDLESVKAQWANILSGVGSVSRSLEGVLRDGAPIAVEGQAVVLGFSHAFHKERIEDAKNRVMVEKVLSRVTGRDCRVRCVLRDKDQVGGAGARALLPARARLDAAAQDPQVQAVLEVFPGAKISEVA